MEPNRSAQALGKLGGMARARRLPAGERRRIAALGGLSRSLARHAVRRIEGNFMALKAADVLRRAFQRRGG